MNRKTSGRPARLRETSAFRIGSWVGWATIGVAECGINGVGCGISEVGCGISGVGWDVISGAGGISV